MYWPDTNTVVDVEPARKPVASAVRKYFTEGGAGVPPSVPGGDWFNQITNELLSVLAAAGIDPSKTDDDQLLQAITSIFSAMSAINQNPDGTVKASRVFDANGVNVENGYKQLTKYGQSLAAMTSQGGVILLGDSIGLSQGAAGYKAGYLYRFMRSLLNRHAGIGAADQGLGYESYLNMATAVNVGGITHNGTLLTGSGAADSRLQLLSGQSITITGRQALTYDIFYDPALSSGNIEFYLNGVLYATKAVSAAISTFQTAPFGTGSSIHPDDVVQIKAATGTVIVTGITTLLEASAAPYVTSVCRSGWGFDEFSVQARVDEVAAQVRFFKSGGPFTVFVMLGTNNIFHPTLRKTPDDYITALNTLVGKYIAALNGVVNIVIQVPLPANESTYPILPGYIYADYVKAIVEYGSANGYPVIRFDRIGASNAYYADGIHPNNAGHAAMTANMCETMGVPYAYGEFHQTPTIDHYREADIVYNAKYKDYSDLTSLRVKAHKQGRLLMMSGMAAPNGATGADLIIGTLSKGMRPVDADVYTVASTNSGPVSIVIKRDGTVNVLAVPSAWISFTGVSFVIRSQS
ncbi:SGNH/GDSL hydrolase family protein [Aeromonas salmonicida]|uniref:GDSL-like lipase/acylhydrolase family protein n=1 Tax=Aeromonas salmonicida TaxID=645 RepID=A0AAX1PKB7_AERSA|nr:SGNH/GDSL hydrolase family protein [Aeromonas salmonicida]RAJ06415.1 GDSL-like lipase/acylhydrolase family protein [Aeromonas salmonicida]